MFLRQPPAGEGVERIYQADLDDDGYVGNLTRLWAWRPEVHEAFIALRGLLTGQSTLSHRELSVIVTSAASTLGDSYCSLAWGEALAAEADAQTAAEVLAGHEPSSLSARDLALARWTRALTHDPNATQAADVDALRDAGLDDREIFEATVFAAFRIAFSTVNDALGARPDRQLAEAAQPEVRAAVSFGRAPDGDA